MAGEFKRNVRKSLVGTVVSQSGNKTVKVSYSYKVPHPLYRKEIKRKTVLFAHDEGNRCKIGDLVSISSTRPLSKLKCWRVVDIIGASEVGTESVSRKD